MAYIKKDTFEIINASTRVDYEEGHVFTHEEYGCVVDELFDQGANLEGYFEVDEFLALAIAELNRKGYPTKFCCSGHVFNEPADCLENGILKYHEHRNNYCYIAFGTEVSFSSLPVGFYLTPKDMILLEKDYISEDGTIERVLEIANTMADLYSWVLTLEDMSKNG
jgi:hypothetical protein